jgi:predicted lactoylglutathione lyase
MKPGISVITLAVEDLQRSLNFYRDGLHLDTEGIVGEKYENGSVVFVSMQPGLYLALWPKTSLAKETGLPVTPHCPTQTLISHNVPFKEAVDQVMEQARLAGATIIKEAQDIFWGGYAGYFQDPDQHLWEIAFNPKLLSSN